MTSLLRTGLRQDLGDVITKRNTWEMMERDLHSTKFTTEEIDDDGIVPHHHVCGSIVGRHVAAFV